MSEIRRESRPIEPVAGVAAPGGEGSVPIQTRGADKPASGSAPAVRHAAEVAGPDLSKLFEGLGPRDNIGLTYVVDQKTHSVIIKVIDRDTNEVVRQIPSEEMAKLKAAMRDLSGLLFKTQV